MVTAAPFRLLCVSHYFESHRGGVEMVAGRLARSLAGRHIAVTWAASDASAKPADIPSLLLRSSNLIERHSGLPFPIPGPTALLRLARAVRASDAVLVHDGMYPSCIAAIVFARLFGRPVLLVQHIGRLPASSLALTALFAAADQFLTRPMLRLASQVVFISATSARHFANARTRREPLLIFNGVDTNIFRPNHSEQERRHEREQLGWPANRPVILFVGRFLAKKGLLRLREMAAARPDLHWAFAGWGPCDPAKWGLTNVSVFRDRSGPKLGPLYRAADLLVLPSKSEGFPLVVQEALACGLHPVCCDDAAQADPSAAAYITEISNRGSEAEVIECYLEAIDRLSSAQTEAEQRQKRAAFASEHYSWDSAARRYRTILRALSAAGEAPVLIESAPA